MCLMTMAAPAGEEKIECVVVRWRMVDPGGGGWARRILLPLPRVVRLRLKGERGGRTETLLRLVEMKVWCCLMALIFSLKEDLRC